MKKVVVTGGAGFIGTNLCMKLARNGYSVVIVDDLSGGSLENLNGFDFEFHRTSVLDLDGLAEAAKGSQHIFHLAALGSVPRSIELPNDTFDVNVIGTKNVLQIARKFGLSITFTSSSSVYGSNQETPKRETMYASPISPYGASKLAGEALIQGYSSSYSLTSHIFRLFNVFGPFQKPDLQYSAVIPKWIWNALHGFPITVYGDLKIKRDFTHVDTVVDILVRTIGMQSTHSMPINLAYGRSISLGDIVRILQACFPSLEVEIVPPRKGDITVSQSDPSRLKKLFEVGAIEDFESAFLGTIAWLKSYKASSMSKSEYF